MADPRVEALRLLLADPERYFAECLRILTKAATTVPFIWNDAQRLLHAEIERQREEIGKVRMLVLKGRQMGTCLDPDTKVLTSDLRWVRIGDVKDGDRLVATDEATSQKDGTKADCRKMRTSVVEKVWKTHLEAFRITFDDGRSVICSGRHRWLSRKSNVEPAWRSIDGTTLSGVKNPNSALRPGDMIRSIVEPWGVGGFDDAWLGGMIDGEGSFDYKKRSGADMTISQVDGPVLERMRSIVRSRGYKHCVVADEGKRKTKLGTKVVRQISISNIPDALKIIGVSRPTRFIGVDWWEGKRLPANGWRTIVSIESVGKRDLIDIQTSTGTFLAEGFVSHNSTYVGGRFYMKTTTAFGRQTLIVTHQDKSTQKLFEMTKRFHKLSPIPVSTARSNAIELLFDRLDASYSLATAGSQDVGRGMTVHNAHLSEFAFWRDAATHLAGLGNAVPDLPGSEIIIESTANGQGNHFHQMWQDAESGIGEYRCVFLPWFWMPEYATPAPPDFVPTEKEARIARIYGLSNDQLLWRRNKAISYGKDKAWLVDQEFPNCAAEAFITATEDPFIDPNDVMEAVNSDYYDRSGPLIVGVDPAEEGKDRTVIAFRRGRVAPRFEKFQKKKPMEVAGIVARIIKEKDPDAVFIDKIGIGSGIVDRLHELGFDRVFGVNSGMAAEDDETYANKRAEMWGRIRTWLQDGPVRLPNEPELISDLCAPKYRYDSKGRYLIEKKEDMKKRGQRSPDYADALGLTFAEYIQGRGLDRNDMPLPGRSHQPASRAGY